MGILDEIRDRKTTVSIAGGVLIVALVVIWSQTKSATLTLNHTLFGGIGQVTAMETATAIHNHGHVLAVIDWSCTISGGSHFDVWQAFQRELKKHSEITLLGPVISEIEHGDGSPGCSSSAFKNLLEQNADVDAVVFFVSLPYWNRLQQTQRIPQRLPPQVIVVDTGLPLGHYADYFANGYVTMLIAQRRDAVPTTPGGPRTEREWFDQYFQVFTPANFELLN